MTPVSLFTRWCTALILTLGAGMLHAASISVTPSASVVTEGDVFDVTIEGTDFTDGTIGGGFSLSWDASVLEVQSYTLTFVGDQTFGQAGTLDNVAGTLMNADVTSLNGTANAAFQIASITFAAIGTGNTLLDLAIGTFPGGSPRVWADATGFNDTNPLFYDGKVAVNPVPVPAAAWLFGSGLLGLGSLSRRKKSANA
ncbi:VPLPA-CTERM sorting domain-containing protein [Mangrovimicrobium sediminis]|uniref:VPLPA-CTERM sorting domain-containing protein n=1 Tax=Mangrovimicrobium sediminis TaxID=2562682 RepID=A0A4Z0M6Y6_9GAMM|nr:cohesin domain-containing protein [Haliea sp. SAOS-164]TGD75432.1 VPLPA-CTERM sorting domain-containing protein [Haliea sp. SAOS-164]